MDHDPNDASETAAESQAEVPGGNVQLGALDCSVAFHLRLAQDASFRTFRRRTGEDDLRPGWYAVLSLIDSNPGITPMGVSRASGRDKSTLTSVLRKLIARKLVQQCAIPSDRRSYGLTLTLDGEELLERLRAHAEAHDGQLDEIAKDRKPELIELLRRIANSLE